MPKKFTGENSKAAVAKARKANAKHDADEKKQIQLEDEYWKDDDKLCQRKQSRKDDRETKKIEALKKKQELRDALSQEEVQLESQMTRPVKKITRAELGSKVHEVDVKAKERDAAARNNIVIIDDETPIAENLNVSEGLVVQAMNIEDAIAALALQEDVDKHPEKRMRAAYTAFEDFRIAELRAENPTLRLSQVRQRLKKEWAKSPHNPMNKL